MLSVRSIPIVILYFWEFVIREAFVIQRMTEENLAKMGKFVIFYRLWHYRQEVDGKLVASSFRMNCCNII